MFKCLTNITRRQRIIPENLFENKRKRDLPKVQIKKRLFSAVFMYV